MKANNQNHAIEYFLTRSTFLGIGFSLLIGMVKQDSILTFIVGTLLGIFINILINKIQKLKGEQNLRDVLHNMKILGIPLRIIMLVFGAFLFTSGLVALQIFASSFFLTESPLWFILLPVVVLVIMISNKDFDTLNNVAGCLFPISLFLTLMSLLALLNYVQIDNIMPLFVTKISTFVKSVLIYTSLITAPRILTLFTTKNNTNNIPMYLLGGFTLIVKVILIIGIVGPILATIYRYPEYLILREIKLMDFIEKIENIVTLSWIFDIFVYLSMSAMFIKELLPKKKSKLTHTILILIMYVITFKFFGEKYEYELLIYKLLPYVCFSALVIIIPTLLIYFSVKKNKA